MNIKIDKIVSEVKEIISKSIDIDSILEEISKKLKEMVFHYDWVGFYILDEEKKGLILGPYSGAQTEHEFIPIGKGVCGVVAQLQKTMVVQDVSKMENYLSCSINVQSEIVVPILKNGKFIAELDIDSHSPAPFTIMDTILLEKICKELAKIF